MTKFGEIKDEHVRRSFIRYIEDQQASWFKMRSEALERINKYLFSLNAGALLASLTYVAAKANNTDVKLSIWCFAIGIIACVSHAGIDYYYVEQCLGSFKKLAKRFFTNEIDWENFVSEGSAVHSKKLDTVLHVIGWVSFLSFVTGLIYGIVKLK